MATGTSKSLLDKISEGHLECCICAEREPKMLNGQHSFCLHCLQKLKEKLGIQQQSLACPLYRRETSQSLTGKNVVDLPTDIKLTALLHEVDLYERA